MNPKYTFGIIFFLLVCLKQQEISAQDFLIDAELRPRMEMRNGYQKPLTTEQKPSFLISNRTRLGAEFDSKMIKARFTIQDARVWGQNRIEANNIGLSFFEAWAELNFAKNFGFRIGRQALSYDYKRLFGESDWTMFGKSHDLGVLKYVNDSIKLYVDFGMAYNTDGENNMETVYDNPKLYQAMTFLHMEKLFCNTFKTSAMFVEESFQNLQNDSLNQQYIDGHYRRFTIGANFEMNNKKIPVNFILTGYYQLGNSVAKTDSIDGKSVHKKLNSFLLAALINYRIIKQLEVCIGGDFYSGSDFYSEKDNTWNKLYGTNHSYNGSMEYWRDVPNEGLVDIYGGIKGFFGQKVTASMLYHFFMTEKILQTAGTSGKALGSEIDLTVKYDIFKFVRFEGGWSIYFNSENTKLMKHIGREVETCFQHWVYASLKINPQLFNTKNHKNKQKMEKYDKNL